MEAKDKIASEELEKVADLNGEVYGHHNAKQKIKHVHQIKSENVTLRQVRFYRDAFTFRKRQAWKK